MRKAHLEDIDEIMDIIKMTILEMHSYNNYQWDENYPQEKDFITDINEGNLYVSERDEKLVAFICVNQIEPDEYSGLDWSSTKEGMVIHRMSVHPEYRRNGVGLELMNFAEVLAQSHNIAYLKTDTNSMNAKMQSLFIKCGYKYIGDISFLGKEEPFYCYDKLLQSSTPLSSIIPKVTSVTSS
ncbi:GNAT family N-acetyltransferase [Desulfosporosinus metallidurans]|uniref:GNAT family N-acetyltransferase n=1 Tax=Desulfosporosinus metallidurans TaxID=1888891 RepID=UPI00094DA313|nr:GNAT family N-acetyltransferase [Desulfosporosinus metallidurans]